MSLILLLVLAAAVAVWFGVELRRLTKPRPTEPSVPEERDPTEPGASALCPIEIPSASVVEPRAASEPCRRCGHSTKVIEHRAEHYEQGDCRVVLLQCRHCEFQDEIYFRITTVH